MSARVLFDKGDRLKTKRKILVQGKCGKRDKVYSFVPAPFRTPLRLKM